MNKIFICISILLISSIKSDLYGIDVSTYQGNIDWNAVKNEASFAIIRMGWGSDGVDDFYEINYQGAKAAGVQIGAYLFSYATDSAGAEAEANHALQLLQGKQFEWPIYYDIEADALGGDVNGMLNTFCQILQQNNYYCGVYSSASPLSTQFDQGVLSQYAVWVAHYGVDSPAFSGDWGIWQYSSEGSVSGIEGNVDMDFARYDYSEVIMSKGFNGY